MSLKLFVSSNYLAARSKLTKESIKRIIKANAEVFSKLE